MPSLFLGGRVLGEYVVYGGGGDDLVDPPGEGVGVVAGGDVVPVGVGDGNAAAFEEFKDAGVSPVDLPLGAELLRHGRLGERDSARCPLAAVKPAPEPPDIYPDIYLG